MNLPNLALTLVLLLGSNPSPEPAALVERLGSPRYAERERAAADLLALGPDALEALRAARRARDAEVRVRVTTLLDRIESDLMVRPTMVALDFKNRPLAEVVKAIGERTRMAMVPADPDNQDLWQDRRVTLEAPGLLPFWTAVDRLCATGKLRYSLGPRGGGHGNLDAGLLLTDRERERDPAPTSDSGPFRVRVSQLHYERSRSFEADEDEAEDGAVREDFHAQLQVWAEPRLLIGQAGPLALTEAVDDQGRSLLPPPAPVVPAGDDADPDEGYDDQPFGQGLVQVQATLKYPGTPVGIIRRLRGSLPLLVAARKPDPLLVPLAESAGKSFLSDGLRLTVHAVKPDPDGQSTTIELTVRPGCGAVGGPDPTSGTRPPAAPALVLESQVEVIDAVGRAIPWSLSAQEVQSDGVRVTLAIATNEEAGAPDRLRVFGLVRALARVPFDFTEIR